MNLRDLLEKTADTDFLREMIGFTAQRLMELEVAEPSLALHTAAEPPTASPTATAIANASRETRAGTVELRIPKPPQGQLLSRLPRTTADGREGTHRGDPRSPSRGAPLVLLRMYSARLSLMTLRIIW